jgi:hypothetical protein
MPHSSFGIGTEFIGKRDFGSDGSFVTTEFQIAMLPLYPIRTVRVVEGKTSTENHFFFRTFHTDYVVLAQGKVNVKQAACVYAYTVFHLTYFVSLAFVGPTWLLAKASIVNPMWILQAAMMAAPAIIPLALRFRARTRASESVAGSCPCGSGLTYASCCSERSESLRKQNRTFYNKFS